MGYCSLEDFRSALGRGLLNHLEQASDGQLKAQQAIDRASSEIDGYLVSGGYNVPLAFVPPNVQNYAIDLAVYNFAVTKGLAKDSAADEALAEKAKVARDFLRLVGQRKLSIPTAGVDAAGESGDSAGGERQIIVRRGITPVNMRGYF